MGSNQTSNSGKCFVISAPSGAGKTTILKKLVQDKPDTFYDSISDTTRTQRAGEISGQDYNFITIPQFKKRISDAEYFEWANVHGNFYGTPKTPTLNAMNEGKCPMLVIDVQGYFEIRDKIPYEKLCSIFILPPNREELVKRINKREKMDEADLEVRLRNSKKESSFASEFKYCLTNDDIDISYPILKFIIEKEIENR